MAYQITKRMGRFGFLGAYDVSVDGENVGEIRAIYPTMNSDRPSGYHTEVALEWDALTDDSGFPNEYRTLAEAKAAVADLMSRNGIAV